MSQALDLVSFVSSTRAAGTEGSQQPLVLFRLNGLAGCAKSEQRDEQALPTELPALVRLSWRAATWRRHATSETPGAPAALGRADNAKAAERWFGGFQRSRW